MPQQNLKDFLLTLTKNELTEIRHYWQFGGISQLNKTELIEALTERIKAQLRDWLKYQLPRNIKFLEKVIQVQPGNKRVAVSFRDVLPESLYNFYYRGILDLIDDEEESLDYLNLRELIIETYRSTDKIERYSYYYLDPGVISPEDIIDEIEMRSTVDYYLPRKKKILYAGRNEQEKLNSVQRKFNKMLIEDFSLFEPEADDILWEMMLDIKNDFSSMSMLQDFASRYEFKSDKQTDEFVSQLNDLHNNTRMWILKGHTPEELFAEEKKHLQPLPKKNKGGSVGEQTVVTVGKARKHQQYVVILKY